MIAVAYVNRGMWIAECSCTWALALEPCGDAQIPGVDWPNRLDVLSCGNCGQILEVSMPVNRGEIEAILNARAVVNRNWRAFETIADLRIENAVHDKELV